MIDNKDICIYFLQKYAQLQQYQSFQIFHSASSLLSVEIREGRAVSLPKSPIGGFFTTETDLSEFHKFFQRTSQALRIMGARSLRIIQAPEIYPLSVSPDWLMQCGFTIETVDFSHYLELKGVLQDRIHLMEQRKLRKNPPLDLSIESAERLEEFHSFISLCRQQKGLTINISFPMLKAQFEAFPDRYLLFGARRHGELVSAVVVTIPVPGIAYYFLPATLEQYKTESPMVHLMDFLYSYFQQRHFRYIDLGISSIQGNPQTSLIRFKENMGGILTRRVTYERTLE